VGVRDRVQKTGKDERRSAENETPIEIVPVRGCLETQKSESFVNKEKERKICLSIGRMSQFESYNRRARKQHLRQQNQGTGPLTVGLGILRPPSGERDEKL